MTQFGINLHKVSDITVDGNIVAYIKSSSNLNSPHGGILSCTWGNPSQSCPRLKITNNIVAGAPWAGFTLYGHRCGEKQTNTGNVAHSINGIGGGVGFLVF